MNIYKVKNLITGQEFEFKSIPKIVEKFGSIKGITEPNLYYHFSTSKCNKEEEFFGGLCIRKIVIN